VGATPGLRERIRARLIQLDFVIRVQRRARRNVTVSLADGAIMRADVFTPGAGRWPVVINATPYQKDGMAGMTGALEAYYLLKAGYAVVLADLRGTGGSDGVSRDPFDGLRADDLCTLVEWAAGQPWSNGRVAVEGTSYGGLAALTAAAENPPALQAVFTLMGPTSFYDSIAFPGGSINMLGAMGTWLNFMNLVNLFPPLCTRNRPDWRTAWRERLDAYTPYTFGPASHPLYDDYWKSKEVAVERVKAPVYVMDGWYGFSHQGAFDLYQRLGGPKKLTVGPWVHTWPSYALVAPIDYVHEMVRWFDCWLKDNDDGIATEPPVALYVNGGDFWKTADSWPPSHSVRRTYYLHPTGDLTIEAGRSPDTLGYTHDPTVGTTAGFKSLYPLGIDYPRPQNDDDVRSLTFNGLVMEEALEIVGEPEVTLTVSTDMPDAALTVRLCDVAPDGRSTLITSGVRRLSRRDGLDRVAEVLPGNLYEMSIRLWPADYLVPAGHRMRLALALADFPRTFPLPYSGQLFLHFGAVGGKLEVDTITASARPAGAEPFRAPDLSLTTGQDMPAPVWEVEHDLDDRRVIVHAGSEAQFPLFHQRTQFHMRHSFDASVTEKKPQTAELHCAASAEFTIDKHIMKFIARQSARHDRIEVSVRAEEDGRAVFEKVFNWPLDWPSVRQLSAAGDKETT